MTLGIPGTKRKRNGNDRYAESPRLRILLTNGRFPVSIDLARQFYWAGHSVYCVDPMMYHVCKFSVAVDKSKRVPAPHDDAKGYIEGIKEMAVKWRIDMIVPVHEEIFFLANCGEPEILNRLFAPPFELLVRLHHKFEFHKLMKRLDLGVPEAYLCKSMEDVKNLPVDKYKNGLALKPCFGRASSGVHHLKPGEELPDDIDIGEHNHHIAQEWIKGDRYCSYSVVTLKHGVEATGLYPVLETIDGSSSVYFKQQHHERIYNYIETMVRKLPGFDGQIALDFVEDGDRLVVMECNPRATSGIHLWTDTPELARAFTDSLGKDAKRPIEPPKTKLGNQPQAEVTPGMMMWEHEKATPRVYARHMLRLMKANDVVWKGRDAMPTIAQPFLLTEYYKLCRQKGGMELPDLFQMDLLWEPHWNKRDPENCQLARIRKMMNEADERDEKAAQDKGDGGGDRHDISSQHIKHDGGRDQTSLARELEEAKQRIKELEDENIKLRHDSGVTMQNGHAH
ncbi:hypothetical protein H2203_008196 [Taxawa tesnikishii (nom. ined.)]|nr:hypothetical protein H2203_008196 [Dothideales sp. JES 119]